MATVVVPFRSSDPKRRLATLSEHARVCLAEAMLADVLAAAAPIGPAYVVSSQQPGLPAGVTHVEDPHRGQGAAVVAALAAGAAAGLRGPYLVVNADLPCVTTRDLLALVGAIPDGGLALVAAADGTTNALALSDAQLFEPVYGPGSAERFAALGPSRPLDLPNLADDIDVPGDFARLGARLGEHTRRVLAELHLETAA
ncbi:MAG TPA: NTP transferase domain-containing protein [Gaiellaceae bacterium]|nr:NTP transferase domain-containing protein [Gaiellaceae bacterium]